MSIDDEIDDLYQLPLSEFTAARNALAKRAGADAARVKALEKPLAAAWAVNQLYWRERKLYDALVKASLRLRTAQAHTLTGKKADIDLAEKAKAAAVRQAVDRAEAILRASGDAATDATLASVRETLNALPAAGTDRDNAPGRLARPLTTATGFEALGDLLRGGVIAPAAAKADVVRFPVRTKLDAGRARAAERDEEARQEAQARAERATALKEITSKRHSAEAALGHAKRSLDELEEDRRDMQARLEKNAASLKHAQSEIERLQRELKQLDRDRAKLERD